MKRNLLLAISVLALTAASQPLSAAESDTPAPAARERAARQARPAPVRQAPQRAPAQQASQSPQSSFTGSQAGGFGGGNSGGGGFADPPCHSSQGLNASGCIPTGLNFSLAKTGGTGGGVYQFMLPFGPYFVAGVMADLAASNSKASSSFSTVHADASPFSTTAENFTASVKQGTNGSVRLKAGVPMYTFLGTTLVYFTAGVVISRIDIDYSYSASSIVSGSCSSFFSACATNSSSNFSSHKTRTGFAGGGGVDIKLPGFGPGVVLGLDYTINTFGSYSETATINTATINGFPCGSSPGQICSATDTLSISKQVYHKPTVSLKVGF